MLLFVLPTFMGLDGIIWATPISDLLSFILATVMLIIEFSHMPKEDMPDAAMVNKNDSGENIVSSEG